MQIYLHIGLPKTGTTSIQNFLSLNSEKLKQDGILYPSEIMFAEQNITQHRILTYFSDKKSVPWLDRQYEHLKEIDFWTKFKEEIFESEKTKIILSSESLSFLNNFQKIVKLFRGHEVRIIIYLRRQDEYLVSLYDTIIRTRLIDTSFDDFVKFSIKRNNAFHQHWKTCYFGNLLHKWERAFGESSIEVVFFNSDFKKNKDLIANFLEKCGIEDWQHFTRSKEILNATGAPDMRWLKRFVNSKLKSENERVVSEKIFSEDIEISDKISQHIYSERALEWSSVIINNFKKTNLKVKSKFDTDDEFEINVPVHLKLTEGDFMKNHFFDETKICQIASSISSLSNINENLYIKEYQEMESKIKKIIRSLIAEVS